MKKAFRWLGKRFDSIYFTIIWILLVVPLLTLLFIAAGGESPLYTSMSRIGWVQGHRLFMVIWSLVVLFPMVCMTNKVIKNSLLPARKKNVLYIIAIVNIIVSFVAGIMVPAKSGAEDINFWGTTHDLLTAVGWLLFGVVLTIYACSLFSVDRLQATLATCFMGFLWVTGIFFIFFVVDESTYCGASAVTQAYIINMLNLFLLLMDLYETLKQRNSNALD